MPSVGAITDLGWELLDDLPPRVFEDPDIRAVVHCAAKESDRQRELAERVRDNLIPARLDLLGLPWWEYLFKLPAPGAATEAQRRERVLTKTRQTSPRVSAKNFKADMDGMVGEGNWEYEEDWPAIRVFVPYKPGSEAFLLVENQIRNLTTFPAHLDVILENVEGFVLDESQLDQDPFHAS
jgi:hypothetical protein